MYCNFFRLIHNEDVLELEDEPIGWDSIFFKIFRDKDWHGLNYEYADGDIQLEFDCVAGGGFIDDLYTEHGLDADIIFQQGVIVEGAEVLEYIGRLALSTFRRLKGRVACSLERKSIHDVVKARFDTKINLFSKNSIDGDDMGEASVITVESHSKTIYQNFTVRDEVQRDSSQGTIATSNAVCVVPNTRGETEIQGINQRDFSVVGLDEPEPFLVSEVNGYFDFSVDIEWTLNTLLQYKFGKKRRYVNYEVATHFYIKSSSGSITYITPKKVHGSGNGPDNTASFSQKCTFDWAGNWYLRQNDRVYLYTKFTYTSKKDLLTYGSDFLNYGARLIKNNITISGNSSTPPTYVKAVMVHEAGERLIRSITGNGDRLLSDFLGRTDIGYPVDGCGSYGSITNGFQLRQFSVTDKGIELSFKTYIESLSAIYCLGLAYENDEAGNDIVRLERIEHFYRDHEVLFIENAADYQEESAQELVFNNIEIGYEKFPEEDEKGLDEFNTRHEYITPIKRHDNKFPKLSKLIASGYAIEYTRRELYTKDGENKKSTKYDDDCFILALHKGETAFRTVQVDLYALFSPAARQIIFYLTEEIQIVAGQRLSLFSPSSSPNAGIEYTVNYSVREHFQAGSYTGFLYRVYINQTPINELVYTPVSFRIYDNIPFRTETNENISVIGNTLLDPGSAYNLRISPKRMLYNWAKWLNGGLMYKNGSELIKNTFTKHNGDLTTRVTVDRNCDIDYFDEIIREGDPIALAGFAERDKFFIPDWVTFTARISKDEVQKIRLAMTNNSLAGDNYGYISVLDPDGNRVSGWVYEMEWSPATEKVFFKLLKYKVLLNNTVPPDQENCQDYADWTFADFEASDIGVWIEDCRFQDFN